MTRNEFIANHVSRMKLITFNNDFFDMGTSLTIKAACELANQLEDAGFAPWVIQKSKEVDTKEDIEIRVCIRCNKRITPEDSHTFNGRHDIYFPLCGSCLEFHQKASSK